MSTEPMISVCVPTYNRPATTERLIRSFLWQRFCAAELIITDDSTTDDVQAIVSKYSASDQRIRYVRNHLRKGYCQNLKAALLLSRGDVSLTLGDDDFFVDPTALSRYRREFDFDSRLVFAYTNRLQVLRDGTPDVAHRAFKGDRRFAPGEDSWSHMWPNADCIAGLAVRAPHGLIDRLIPETSILYPQVLLVGELMKTGTSFGFADYLVATSVDETLLGYAVSNGAHVFGQERHGSLEYMDIVREVVEDEIVRKRVENAVARHLAVALAITLPDEKLYCGRRIALRNATNFRRRTSAARRSIPLLVSLGATAVLPAAVLQRIKKGVKSIARRRNEVVWAQYEANVAEILAAV